MAWSSFPSALVRAPKEEPGMAEEPIVLEIFSDYV